MDLRKFLVFIVLFGVLSGFHFFVFAQDAVSPNDDFLGIEDFTVQKIAAIITGFACWLISIVLAIMVIFLIIAGVRYFWARGNPIEVTNATNNLKWTLVGILVILATNVIIATVANALGIEDFTVQKIAAIITGFACWLIGIVLAVMVIFLIIAGVRYFWARGNPIEVTNATNNLKWTLVGILVILATNVIIATVANALGGSYSFLPLNCARVTTTIGRSCSDTNPCLAGQTCSNPGTDGRRICVQ